MTALAMALCLCPLIHEVSLPQGVRWQTIEAAHFRVIFPEGLEGLAHEAVVALEAAREALLQERGYAPMDKIALVLHDSSDLGEVTVDVLSNRIVLSVAQAECAAPVESLLQAAISHGYSHLRDSPDALPEIVRPWLRLWRALWESQSEPWCEARNAAPLQIPSPDGQQILTLKRDWYQHFYLYGDLYLLDKRTGREERLTNGARIYRAAFFPDGERVLLAQYRWGDRGPILSILDIQTKEITPLKEFPVHDYFPHSFAISPDGRQGRSLIALSLWRRGGFQDIYLAPSPLQGEGWGEGVKLQQITRDRVPDRDPVFSPDGQFVLFARDQQRYAYRLSDGAFFKIEAHLDAPLEWESVQLDKEPFPSWEGFPETDYPIIPYDPRTTLDPQLWIPLVGTHGRAPLLGLATFGEDALRHHRYQFALGFDGERLEPFYRLRYDDQQFLLSFSALLQKDRTGSQQKAAMTLPLVTTRAVQHRLSLFYHREEQEKTAHTIGLIWSGTLTPSLSLLGRGREGEGVQPRLEFSLTAQTHTRTGQRLWENLLSLQAQATLPLPQGHALRLSLRSTDLSWRIGYRLPLGPRVRGEFFVSGVRWGGELELALSRLWSPRLGIAWSAEKLEVYMSFWGD